MEFIILPNGTTSDNYCGSKLMETQCRWWRIQYEVRLLWAVVSMATFTLLATILIIFLEGKSDMDLSTAEEDKFHFWNVVTVLKESGSMDDFSSILLCVRCI